MLIAKLQKKFKKGNWYGLAKDKGYGRRDCRGLNWRKYTACTEEKSHIK